MLSYIIHFQPVEVEAKVQNGDESSSETGSSSSGSESGSTDSESEWVTTLGDGSHEKYMHQLVKFLRILKKLVCNIVKHGSLFTRRFSYNINLNLWGYKIFMLFSKSEIYNGCMYFKSSYLFEKNRSWFHSNNWCI